MPARAAFPQIRPYRTGYRARVRLPEPRSYKSVYGETAAEVRQEVTRLLAELDQGRPVNRKSETLADYLPRWLEETHARKIGPTTLDHYRRYVERHVLPYLGQVRLDRLTPRHVQEWVSTLLKAGQSPSSVRRYHAVLSGALQQAMRWELVGRNVARLAELPSKGKRLPVRITPAEARAIVAAIQGDRLEALYLLCLTTGLRQGEALALRWSDLNLPARTLTVTRSLAVVRGKFVVKEPKNESSKRTVPLSATAVAALQAHRARQHAERLRLGAAWVKSDLVFSDEGGHYLHRTKATRGFQACLQRVGLAHLRFHDTRHAAAGLLLGAGRSLKEVSELLGHSSITMTADLYGHLADEAKRPAAEAMDELLRERA